MTAATGLVILLKLDSNRRFFSPWPWNLMDDIKIVGHLFYTTSSFMHHFNAISEIELQLDSVNNQFGSKSAICLSRVTFKFDGWPWKTTGHLFYVASSFVHRVKAIGEFKLPLESGKSEFGLKSSILFVPSDLEIRQMTLKNNRAHLLCCFKLCASLHSHQWIITGVPVLKHPIRFKIDDFFSSVSLKFDRWPWKTNRKPLLCYTKLCASFRSHWWIQTWVTVWKLPIRFKIEEFFSRVTLKFDGWP